MGLPPIYDKLRHLNSQQQTRSARQRPEENFPSYQGITSLPVELTYFGFDKLVSDAELDTKAKRARLNYRLLQRDKHFLLGLKQLWQDKLEQLQLEHEHLKQMSTLTPMDLRTVPPVFSEMSTSSTSLTGQPQEPQQPIQPWRSMKRKRKQEEVQEQEDLQRLALEPQHHIIQEPHIKQEQQSPERHVDEFEFDFDEGSLSSWSDREWSCESSDYITADDMYTDDDDSLFDSIEPPTLHSVTAPPTPVATSSSSQQRGIMSLAKYPSQVNDSDSDDYFDTM